ncbi:MAG: hypothetical protein ACRDSZ_23745 [Pseudonocardiaceae bacterium]
MTTNNEQQVGRCLCVAVDAEGYGRSGDRQQFTAQKALTDKVLATAAEAAGLERNTWIRQPAGDGELALLPSNEPEPRVVDDLVREIDLALRRYNHDLVRDAQLRLRVAIHHGVAYPASNGFAGQAVVVVSRLLSCRPLRSALAAAADAHLALIVSRRIFEEIIAQEHTSQRPGHFRKIAVQEKEFRDDAWIWLPGADVHHLDIENDGTTAAHTSPVSPAAVAGNGAATVQTGADATANVVHNRFDDKVDIRRGVIGISYGRRERS